MSVPHAELVALVDQIGRDWDALIADGIDVVLIADGRGCVEVGLGTASRQAHRHAKRVLGERYGPLVRVLPGGRKSTLPLAPSQAVRTVTYYRSGERRLVLVFDSASMALRASLRSALTAPASRGYVTAGG